jgi:pimeloyl-ACP methyl ester carboxylesterase
MAEHFPEANVIALPNSGHFPHVAHPVEFARVLASAAVSNKEHSHA